MKAGWMTMPLAFVAALAFLFAVGTSGAGSDGDSDSDGVQDNLDNCTAIANPTQYDTDQDGYGNACDMDDDQNGAVGSTDYGELVFSFGTSKGDAAYNGNLDCDQNEVIGSVDYGCLISQFGTAPGPSGRSCANIAGDACPDPDLPL